MKSAITLCSLVFASFAQAYQPQTIALGSKAPDFRLIGVDDQHHTLADFSGGKALAVIFTTNHCPDAIASHGRMVALVDQFKEKGVNFVAINSNSPEGLHLPELCWTMYDDGFEHMKLIAEESQFNLPYLYDGETQEVAKAYGAVATPHAFIFDGDLKLVYEGRIDNGKRRRGPVEKNEARDAIEAVLRGETPAVTKTRPVGCSMKWKEKAAKVAKENQKWKELPVTVDMIEPEAVTKLVANKGREGMRLINLWSLSCGPCVQEFPDLSDIGRQYSWRPFEFIPISLDDPGQVKEVTEFLKTHECGLSPRVVGKLVKEDGRTTNNYIFKGDTEDLGKALPGWNGSMPYTVLIGADGKKLFEHHGIIDPLEVKKVIVEEFWASSAEK